MLNVITLGQTKYYQNKHLITLTELEVECKLLSVITLGKRETDNISQ
jgi:hypothetical protein